MPVAVGWRRAEGIKVELRYLALFTGFEIDCLQARNLLIFPLNEVMHKALSKS